MLRQFIAADPARVNRIPAHVLLAQAHDGARQFDGAIAEWRAVIGSRPTDRNARAQLAGLLAAQAETRLRRDDGERGEPYAREAAQLAPQDPAVHNLLERRWRRPGASTRRSSQFREALQVKRPTIRRRAPTSSGRFADSLRHRDDVFVR